MLQSTPRGGPGHPEGLQAVVRPARLLQISLQDNGQGVRHGQGRGRTVDSTKKQELTIKCHFFQIADDDQLLPGVEGKIVVWVEEE